MVLNEDADADEDDDEDEMSNMSMGSKPAGFLSNASCAFIEVVERRGVVLSTEY